MNISGVLVFAKPGGLDSIREKLIGISGVEVHAVTPEGKMVVTIESDDMSDTVDRVTQLQNVDHVLSVSMIYNHIDDADSNVAKDVNDGREVSLCSCAD